MIVLVLPDCHAPCLRRGAIDFLKRIADDYQPDRIVHIGDLVDNAAISYHEKHPGLSSAKEERKKAMRQVQALYRAFPKADLLLGNHDCLTERQAITAGIDPELLRNFGDVWEIPGWTCHPRYTKLCIDNVLYSHGDAGKGGQDAAIKQAKDNFRSTVIGHFHSQGGVKFWANRDFRIFGMNVGCLADHNKLEFEYAVKIPDKPILGCGIVVDGNQAYFEPWLLKSR